MPWFDTSTLQPGIRHPDNDQIYNALDCCLTLEIFEELTALGAPPPVYSFSRALQAPALAMMQRGFRIDEYERQKGLEALRAQRETLMVVLQEFSAAVWDRPLNPASPKQLSEFFYRTMGLPVQFNFSHGQKKPSTNRECLEALTLYLHARPIVNVILAIRDLDGNIEDFEQGLEGGRFYTSFNIAGTETWRFSSSKSSRGTGGNIQNKRRDDDIAEGALSLRRPFIADPGWKLCEIDLEQAESREVGWSCWCLFGDPAYLDACESGDLHTNVARMTWPELPWTGEPKADRAIAERLFYRNNTYRDMSKKEGHASNYYGQPFTIARQMKVPQKMVQEFQGRYFAAFPGIPRWHRHTAQELQTIHRITNSFGASRMFFGRPNDDTTLREAIAHGPQSSTAMRTNLGMWRIWRRMPGVELLAQKHDSVTFQFPEDWGDVAIGPACNLMSTPLQHAGRTFDVPCEAKVGWNWGRYDPKLNPNGMRKWTGEDRRIRLDGMERVL